MLPVYGTKNKLMHGTHKEGGKIICQLWHMGRTVHPLFYPIPISASATTAPGYAHTYEGKKPYMQAKALPKEEIPRLLKDYARAANHAMDAGFDGVQIHAANGYLIDEFLRDSSNFRQDEYGGSIENRIRLLIEITKIVCHSIGSDRTAVRLSPNERVQGVFDNNAQLLFIAASQALSKENINFLEVREPQIGHQNNYVEKDLTDADFYPAIFPSMRENFKGNFVINGTYDGQSAQKIVKTGQADAVSFGRPYISNPDLVTKIKIGKPCVSHDQSMWYTQNEKGYTDF